MLKKFKQFESNIIYAFIESENSINSISFVGRLMNNDERKLEL